MFNEILENRDKTLNTILKLGRYLGRSLRENVEFFKYNPETNRVYYVTETKKIVSGVLKDNSITSIEVTNADSYLDENKFNKLVESHLTSWLGNLYVDKYLNATKDYKKTLSLWTERIKLTKLSKVLEEKLFNLSENKNILNTKEFKQLQEVFPSIIKFLKENKNKISKVPEIKNGVVLSNVVAKAFNMPKLTYKDLTEIKSISLDENENLDSLFNFITKQELIKHELLESKKNFNSIWLTNKQIHKLAESINETPEKCAVALSNVLSKIPYFAFLSKKQITEVFDSVLNVTDNLVPTKNIQEFSSYVFELKKPVRVKLIELLDEKYGINVQNLKEPPTYRSLLNTQIIILETIRKLMPKDSVNRKVLREATELLKIRDGVEAIDVNSIINNLFSQSEYAFVSESAINRYLDFDKIANDLGSVSTILKMIKGDGMAGGMQPGVPGAMGTQTPPIPGANVGTGAPLQTSMMKPGMGGNGAGIMGDKSEEDMTGLTPEDSEENVEMPGQPGMGQPGMGMPGQEGAPPIQMAKDQLMANMAELEELMNSLKIELGQGDEMVPGGEEGGFAPGMPGQEGEEGGNPFEEGEEGQDINIDTGDGDDEVHVDAPKGSHDIEDEEEMEDEVAPQKKEKPKGKSDGKPSFGKKESKPKDKPAKKESK